MKQLCLMRHAKSSWKEKGATDHDRPLNRRGLRDAPRMARWIVQQGLAPQAILSSSALRARTTAAIVADQCDLQESLHCVPELYLARPEEYLTQLRQLDDTVQCALVVGHNPGLEHLLALLSGQQRELPTAALALLQLGPTQWRHVSLDGQAQLVHLWRPKDLPDEA